jgi:hypothetical protein
VLLDLACQMEAKCGPRLSDDKYIQATPCWLLHCCRNVRQFFLFCLIGYAG